MGNFSSTVNFNKYMLNRQTNFKQLTGSRGLDHKKYDLGNSSTNYV